MSVALLGRAQEDLSNEPAGIHHAARWQRGCLAIKSSNSWQQAAPKSRRNVEFLVKSGDDQYTSFKPLDSSGP